MKSSRDLHIKTYVFILLMVTFGPLGDALLSKRMKDVGAITSWAPANLLHVFVLAFSSGMIWLGISSLLAFFVAYTLVLSWADYSYVQPASSFAVGIVALAGHFLLGEAVSPLRWTGVAIICLGVLIVGHTPPRTTEQK